MCEFCLQHGEGQKWYLQAKNYSQDLLSDAHRRKFIGDFSSVPTEKRSRSARNFDASLDQLNRAFSAWLDPDRGVEELKEEVAGARGEGSVRVRTGPRGPPSRSSHCRRPA